MTAPLLHAVPNNVNEVPYQDASLDIWDTKYRLKTRDGDLVDQTLDDSYERVARALSEVEATPKLKKEWTEHFLWALRHGAIHAGRSNFSFHVASVFRPIHNSCGTC